MANTGIAQVASTIQKVVSRTLTQTLIQDSVYLAMPGTWDRSGEVEPGMDRLDMHFLTEIDEQDVDETGIALTPATIMPNAAFLNLDQHKAIPFSVTKRGVLQSKIALVQQTITNGVKTLSHGIDNHGFSVAVAAALNTATTATADGLEALRQCAKVFDMENVPKQGRSVAVSPGFLHDDLLSTSNVIRANEFGSADPVRMGAVANIYGMMIYESTSASIPVGGFIATGMEAMAFARQKSLILETEKRVLNFKDDYALSHLFGSASTVEGAASNPRIYVYAPPVAP